MIPLTYAPIVPLIGGEPIGAMNALNGQLPEYVMSYSPFQNNDKHYINYLRTKRNWDGEYVLLDDIKFNLSTTKTPYVDIVMATCPCAGLSSYSTKSSASNSTNDWLPKTAEYVLENIKPRVFWGENAPRLFTKMGKSIVDKLIDIGHKSGYSLNLFYTESHLHGLCQKRPRTFYFFTDSKTAPIFATHRRNVIPVEDILDIDYNENDLMLDIANLKSPYENGWLQYALFRSGLTSLTQLGTIFEESQNLIVAAERHYEGGLIRAAQWMTENGFEIEGKRAIAMQKKLDDGKGYWGHGITYGKGIIPSLIGDLPYSLLNTKRDRYINIRDCLRLMGLPEDFCLLHDNPRREINHICQTVPCLTAKDMMNVVINYINGDCEMSKDSSFIKQNNKNMKIENNSTQTLNSISPFMYCD